MLAGGCGHWKGWLELEDPLPTWLLDQISLCSQSLTARHRTSPSKGDRRRAKRKPQWVLWTSLQNHTLPLFSSWPEVSPWSRSLARRRELGSPLEERRIKGFVDILLTHRHLCDLEPEISSSPVYLHWCQTFFSALLMGLPAEASTSGREAQASRSCHSGINQEQVLVHFFLTYIAIRNQNFWL